MLPVDAGPSAYDPDLLEIAAYAAETLRVGVVIAGEDVLAAAGIEGQEPLSRGRRFDGPIEGMPLLATETVTEGVTFYLLGQTPRTLEESERRTLKFLARQAGARLEAIDRRHQLQAERTASALIERSAHEKDEFLRMVTDRMPVRVGYVDPQFRYIFLNGEYERMFGFAPGEAWGRTVEEIVGTEAWLAAEADLRRAMEGESHHREFDVRYPFGERRVQASYVADRTSDGIVRGVVVHAVDVTERWAQERALAESEAHYRTLFDSIDEGFCTFETIFDEAGTCVDYRFLEVNDAFVELTGLSREDALGPLTLRQMVPGHEQRWFDLYGQVALTGEPLRVEDHAAALGRRYEIHAFRIGGEGSREVGAIFKDVASRYENEVALAEQRARQDRTLENADVATYDWDPVADRVHANPLLARFFGVSDEDARGGPVERYFAAIHPEDRERTVQAIRASLATGSRYEVQYRVTGAEGRERWVLARGDTTLDAEGKPQRLSGVVLDVTERARMDAERERLLTEIGVERERLKALFRFAPAAVAVLRTEALRFEYTNEAYRTMFTGGEDVAGKILAEVLPEACEQGFDILLRKVMATGAPFKHSEMPFEIHETLDGPGRILYVDFVYQPIWEADGTVSGVFAHIIDVTAPVLAREAIAQIEMDRRLALDSAGIGAWNLDVATMALSGDERFWLLFGGREESFGYEEALSRIHPDDRDTVRTAVEAAIRPFDALPYAIEYRVVHPDGSVHWLAAAGRGNTRGEGPDAILVSMDGTVVDVTDRKMAEAALRASERQFRQLVDLSPSTVWFGELDGGLSYISQDFYDATGLTPEEALPNGWISTVHPDEVSHVAETWTAARGAETIYDTEFRIRFRNGEYRWVSVRAVPVRGEEGEVTGWLGSNSDIHERKTAEETLQARVEERTAELKRAVAEAEGFNYSISHDLRTPLRAMVSTASILLEEVGPSLDEEYRDLLERQAHNANRMGRLIDDLLRLSRYARVAVKRERLDLGAMARGVFADLAAHGDVKGCRFEAEEGLIADADPELVRTVLGNLIGNACKFSPKGGAIRMRRQGEAFAVSDEGVGFDMRYAPKIFLPFERLVADSEFPGTGIGLANVKRIVERHGGRVTVQSTPGEGATFSFTLG